MQYSKKNKKKKVTIAVFDFDGTITKRDTFNHIIIKNFGLLNFIICFIFASPFVLFYLLGFVRNDVPKTFIFRWFFKGMPYNKFKSICIDYNKKIDHIIKKNALNKINYHLKSGHIVIINSASILDWVGLWASKKRLHYAIATEVEIINGLLSGNFSTRCCYGEEKVRRMLEIFPDLDSYTIYAYGDSRGDNQLLSIADKPFYKSFD